MKDNPIKFTHAYDIFDESPHDIRIVGQSTVSYKRDKPGCNDWFIRWPLVHDLHQRLCVEGPLRITFNDKQPAVRPLFKRWDELIARYSTVVCKPYPIRGYSSTHADFGITSEPSTHDMPNSDPHTYNLGGALVGKFKLNPEFGDARPASQSYSVSLSHRRNGEYGKSMFSPRESMVRDLNDSVKLMNNSPVVTKPVHYKTQIPAHRKTQFVMSASGATIGESPFNIINLLDRMGFENYRPSEPDMGELESSGQAIVFWAVKNNLITRFKYEATERAWFVHVLTYGTNPFAQLHTTITSGNVLESDTFLPAMGKLITIGRFNVLSKRKLCGPITMISNMAEGMRMRARRAMYSTPLPMTHYLQSAAFTYGISKTLSLVIKQLNLPTSVSGITPDDPKHEGTQRLRLSNLAHSGWDCRTDGPGHVELQLTMHVLIGSIEPHVVARMLDNMMYTLPMDDIPGSNAYGGVDTNRARFHSEKPNTLCRVSLRVPDTSDRAVVVAKMIQVQRQMWQLMCDYLKDHAPTPDMVKLIIEEG